MVATATRKLVGGRFMAMTTGPDRSMPDAATAATGVITACTGAVLPGNTGAALPTALANTNGAIAATPNAGARVRRQAPRRTAATAGRAPQRPPMCTRPSSVCEPSETYVFLASFFVS